MDRSFDAGTSRNGCGPNREGKNSTNCDSSTEYQVRSGAYGNVSGLTLSRLPRREVVEMTQLALRKQSVPTAVMNRIVDESDSIPLFVEELARGALESSVI